MVVVTYLTKQYPTSQGVITALEDVSFSAKKGEFIVLLGPSGCGKSTLLNLIAQLDQPTKGSITCLPKDIGFVFQQPIAFPWLTVEKNVEFILNISQQEKTVDYFLKQVGLQKFTHLYPKELSGGMRQRLTLAMILAKNPELLLMDEPFSSLDAQTRAKMQELVKSLTKGKTVIFVTHDIDEAIFLADKIYVMQAHPGKIVKEIQIDLDCRTYEDTLTPEFIRLKKQLLTTLNLSLY